MEITAIPITHLIPQRPPFVMVDKVLSCDDTNAVTVFTVRPDNIFLDDGKLSAAGLIENMAQACASKMGCSDVMHNAPIKLGFIGDIHNAEIIRRPACNEQLHTHVQIIEEVFSLMLANVSVKVGDETIASARMKLAKTDIIAKLEDTTDSPTD